MKQTEPNNIPNKYRNHIKGKRKQKKIQLIQMNTVLDYIPSRYTSSVRMGLWGDRILQIKLELFLTGLLR